MINLSCRCRQDCLAGLGLAILPALVYPLAALRQGVFYVGDIFRLYYPQRTVYADALRAGHVPLWSPDVLAGYPLLAEGQTGVFYPLNLLLYRFLPIDVALNYSILLSLSLASVAMYVLGRVLRLRPAAALLAALTFAYGGFFVGHFNHLNIMAAAPWLPLELAIIERALRITQPPRAELVSERTPSSLSESVPLTNKNATYRVRGPDLTTRYGQPGSPDPVLRQTARHVPSNPWSATALVPALGLTIGVQFLAGHPQIWLMSILAVLAFGLFRAIWPASGARRPMARALRLFAPIAVAVLTGLAVAAVQLLPTWELVQESVRAGGLSADFLTSFSWHPALVATLIVPFVLGNPYPDISVELAAYLGLFPLVLAFAAVVLRRERLTAFLVGLGGVALVLAFGDYTPLYAPLARVPLLNLFRVPARFLYPFTLAVALLAGLGLDVLLARYDDSRPLRSPYEDQPFTPAHWRLCTLAPLLVAGAVVVSALGIRASSLDTLLALRWVLPAMSLTLAATLFILAWKQRIGRRTFAWVAVGLTLVDLNTFGAVYRLTYNDLMPVEAFHDEPASLSFFPEDTHTYRTLTHQAIVPALSVMRASVYPNIGLLHGIPSATGYFPLTPIRHARYLADTSILRGAQDAVGLSTGLTPGRLNLLNVRYFLIPQLLPVDPETEHYDLHNPFTPDPVGSAIDIPPTRADVVELISFTSQSADWPQSDVVAEIVLTGDDGSITTLLVRAGLHTAEWAYDRPDVREHIQHNRPAIARTWPARSGFPPEDHPGHAYRARYQLPVPMDVSRVQVIPRRAAGLIHIEETALVWQNERHTLAELLGQGHHQLAYRDPDVAIYENLDALPRAFVVHRSRMVPDDEAILSIIDNPNFDPCSEVLLTGDPSLRGRRGAGEQGRRSKTSNEAQASALLHPCTAEPLLEYTPRRVEVQAELAQPGYLVLLDSYYPGWHATVDGQPAPIWRADVLFRAVALEPGRHLVAFVYDPLAFRVGGAISLAALVGLAGATLGFILRRRRAPTQQCRLGPTPNI